MESAIYLVSFAKAFFVSVVLTGIFVWVSKKINSKSKKSWRFCNAKGVSRLGGAAIIVAFLFSILSASNLFISQRLWIIIAASSFILLIGLWDDFRELSWKTQLLLQVILAVLVFTYGLRIEYITNLWSNKLILLNLNQIYYFLSFILTTAWILIMINSMNWLDGIDGLSGGVAFIASLVMFFLVLKPEVNQPSVGLITLSLAGSVLGFLIFNFHPSKILAGTSGSFFMGFILASLAIFAGTKIATTLLVMAIPVFDFVWVILERIRLKKSIFERDTSHLHYKLSKLGFSPGKIALPLYAVTISIGFVALNTRAMGKTVTIIAVCAILLLAYFLIQQKLTAEKK
jgi:UDP-GlcNAc:undecaprenyl-phosphate GlcNAc-1-phosphate transferase